MQIGKDLVVLDLEQESIAAVLFYLRSDVSADNSIFKYYNGGFGDANVINFKADGTGYFVGGLYAGGRDTSSTTTAGVDVNGTGSLYIQGKGTTTDGATIFQYSRGTDAANIKFTADGRYLANSSGQPMDIGTSKTPADKYTILALRSDTSTAGSGNAVVEMKSDGSATFEGKVTSVNNIR